MKEFILDDDLRHLIAVARMMVESFLKSDYHWTEKKRDALTRALDALNQLPKPTVGIHVILGLEFEEDYDFDYGSYAEYNKVELTISGKSIKLRAEGYITDKQVASSPRDYKDIIINIKGEKYNISDLPILEKAITNYLKRGAKLYVKP